MKSFTITITDEQNDILIRIAEKEKITVKQLVVNQMKYYLKTVIKSFITNCPELTDTQSDELNGIILTTKNNYLKSIKK